MKEKTPRSGKNVLLAAAGMIAAGTLVFGWLSEGVLAAESAGTSQVPTSYSRIVLPETVLPLANSSNSELQKSNEEANYIIEKDEFGGTPDAKDIPMDQAASIGAQELEKIFGIDLEDANITMKYFPATELFPRAYWYGSAELPGKKASLDNPGVRNYGFNVDAVTGNILCSQVVRYVDGPEISGFSGFDKELSKDPSAYTEKAKEIGEHFNVVQSKIVSAEYTSQGYTSNDPYVTITLTGENGRRAKISISQHDQTLTDIQYEEWIVFADMGTEALHRQIKAGAGGDKITHIEEVFDDADISYKSGDDSQTP